jgi:hypothetical protein
MQCLPFCPLPRALVQANGQNPLKMPFSTKKATIVTVRRPQYTCRPIIITIEKRNSKNKQELIHFYLFLLLFGVMVKTKPAVGRGRAGTTSREFPRLLSQTTAVAPATQGIKRKAFVR